MTQILHSAKGSIQDDKRSDSIQDDRHHFFAPHLFPSLTCVQAIINIRFVWHPVCALLSNSPDKCAADPRFTAYIQCSLHTSHLLCRHVCCRSLFYAIRGNFHAHMSRMGQWDCPVL